MSKPKYCKNSGLVIPDRYCKACIFTGTNKCVAKAKKGKK
jgi:hypothetical protein